VVKLQSPGHDPEGKRWLVANRSIDAIVPETG